VEVVASVCCAALGYVSELIDEVRCVCARGEDLSDLAHSHLRVLEAKA